MTIQIQVPIEEALLRRALSLGKQATTEEMIRDAVAAYIRLQEITELIDEAQQMEWVPPEKRDDPLRHERTVSHLPPK